MPFEFGDIVLVANAEGVGRTLVKVIRSRALK